MSDTPPGRRAQLVNAIRGIGLLTLVVSLLAPLFLGLLDIRSALGADDANIVVVGKIDGEISPAMAKYVERVINRGEHENASAIVFEMDTPGGLSSSMDDIVRQILESDIPVAVYTMPRGARAASAGVFISYAAHIAAMAPGTNIGSASPIFSGSDSDGNDTLRRKVTNDAVSQIVNLANLRGRNADWAEDAVRNAVNVTADQALQLHVVDLLADDLPSLLSQINGRTVTTDSGTVTIDTTNAEIKTIDMSVLEEILQLITDPTIAYLFLSLGLVGLYLELSHPGISVPGIAGALGLLLGLYGLGTLPVNWTGVLLIALGFVLIAIDLFVASLGTLTIGGAVSFILGSYMLFGADAPSGYEIQPAAIWTLAGCMLALSLFLGAAVLRARLRPPATGKQVLIGKIGTTRTQLAPTGMVFVDGELWSARLAPEELGPIAEGESVIVTAAEKLKLAVRRATASELQQAQEVEQKREIGDRTEVIPVGQPPVRLSH
jgi:membrane-bound serine protease (ClpP class)